MRLPQVFFVLMLAMLAPGCADSGGHQAVDTFATEVEARAGVPFAQEGADSTQATIEKVPR